MHRTTFTLIVVTAVGSLVGWVHGQTTDATIHSTEHLVGTWRAVLDSPGGDLPFTLRINPTGSQPPAVAINGDEQVPFSRLDVEGSRVVLHIDWYDSQIVASLDARGGRLTGTWSRPYPNHVSTLPFTAIRHDARRFLSEFIAPTDATSSIDGAWVVEFEDESGASPARAEFRQDGRRVQGTFLTPTGDYRFLDGMFEGRRLRLSCFDGAHLFLFDATLDRDDRIRGGFWSRDSYHATWTAGRADDTTAALDDPWQLVRVVSPDRRLRFAFPDASGQIIAADDARFDDKVVIVNIFGTWCPNCHDDAPLLAEWDRRYRDQGVEIVGLAYEFSTDDAKCRTQIERFAKRHDLDFPLLRAGTSDKKAAARTLPDLSAVIAFPTTVFIGRDGTVRKIYTGFSGPGTGEHHEQLVREMTQVVEALIRE